MSFAPTFVVKERRTAVTGDGKPWSYYVAEPVAEAASLEELVLVLATRVGTDALGRLAERLQHWYEEAVVLEVKAKHAIARAENARARLVLTRVDGAHAACGPHDDGDPDGDLPDTDLDTSPPDDGDEPVIAGG